MLEMPRQGGSNEYPQSMCGSKKRKIGIPLHTQVSLYKSGFKGVHITLTCSVMLLLFLQRKLLLFHRRTCHDDVKSRDFQCSHCGSCFYSKAMLQRHEKTIHMNYRPFKCETCSKTFQSRQNLQGHERSHTGEKPYKCDQCNYATALSSSLRTHKMCHTGEKPFKCDLCEFRCRIRPTLRTHMLIHTPRELVACKICGKKLKTKKILQVHMQKMHMREKINIVIYEGESDSLVDD